MYGVSILRSIIITVPIVQLNFTVHSLTGMVGMVVLSVTDTVHPSILLVDVVYIALPL